MKHIFNNHVYVCIFITKFCFILVLNKVTCLSRLRTLYTSIRLLYFLLEKRKVYELARTIYVDIFLANFLLMIFNFMNPDLDLYPRLAVAFK